jgi:hypothetical protein
MSTEDDSEEDSDERGTELHALQSPKGTPSAMSPPPSMDAQDDRYDEPPDHVPSHSRQSVEIPLLADSHLADTPLTDPSHTSQSWWPRMRRKNNSRKLSGTATQPSVFDDPETAKYHQPPASWENIHRFDPTARWTWGEEYAILRKIDWRIMLFTCIMFMVLELDRANLTQAVTDNFLGDLNMDTNGLDHDATIRGLQLTTGQTTTGATPSSSSASSAPSCRHSSYRNC